MALPEEAKEILTPLVERLALLLESELPSTLGSKVAATLLRQKGVDALELVAISLGLVPSVEVEAEEIKGAIVFKDQG